MPSVSVRYIVDDVDAAIESSPELRKRGARFRSDIIEGVGGNQILVDASLAGS